jgi:hypothetical protein
MKIISIIKNLFIKTAYKPTPLGRWNIETCNVKVNNKIDLSNEDHCGPCGEYRIINKNAVNLLENEDKLKKK